MYRLEGKIGQPIDIGEVNLSAGEGEVDMKVEIETRQQGTR